MNWSIVQAQVDRNIDYLSDSEGYMRICDSEDDEAVRSLVEKHGGGVAIVIRMENYKGSIVDVVVSTRTSALYPITFFWSTHLMNFISADTLCVTYPSLTLTGRGCFNPFRLYGDNNFMPYMTEYEREVFEILTFVHNDPLQFVCAPNATCPHLLRTFFDEHSLRFQFSTFDGNDPLSRPDFHPCWRMGGSACGSHCDLKTDRFVGMVNGNDLRARIYPIFDISFQAD